ncbi:MAG: CHASE3 domain-containing protein, partial [Nitrososphaerota archaeon]
MSLSQIVLHESSSFRGYLLTGDQTFLTRLEEKKADFQETIRTIKTLTNDDSILRLLSTVESKEQAWHQEAVNLLIDERKKVDAGQIKMDDLAKSFQTLLDPSLNQQITSANDEVVKIVNEEMVVGTALAYQTMLIILVVEISFGAVLTFAISR